MSQDILGLAKQGNPRAIAALLNRWTRTMGVTAKATTQEHCLHVLVEAANSPSQESIVAFVHKVMQQLEVESIHTVRIYGRPVDGSHTVWQADLDLTASPQPLPEETDEMAQFLQGNSEESTDPDDVVPGAVDTLQPTGEAEPSMELTDLSAMELDSESSGPQPVVPPAQATPDPLAANESDLDFSEEPLESTEPAELSIPTANFKADETAPIPPEEPVTVFTDFSEVAPEAELGSEMDEVSEPVPMEESAALHPPHLLEPDVLVSEAISLEPNEREEVRVSIEPEQLSEVVPEAVPEVVSLVVPTTISPLEPDDELQAFSAERLLERPEAVALLTVALFLLLWQAYLDILDELDPPDPSLSGRKLARRLGVDSSTISRRKERVDFSQWSQSLDPDGIPWGYRDNGRFMPLP